MSFALLDAVFSPTALCLSDPGIRLIDLNTGLGLWHLDIGSNHLAFNSSDQRFYCVGSTFPGRIPNAPDRNSLLRLASSIQECDEVVTLGAGASWGTAFAQSGRVFATTQGDVFETSTGARLAHLDFPGRDYPEA
jgi:hypothetical protein